jgi:hypothetical protein
MQMKRKLLLLLASCSVVVLITLPVADIVGEPLQQQLIQTMGHGAGG